MAAPQLNRQLKQTDQKLRAWDLQLCVCLWAIILLIGLFVFGISDMVFKMGRGGRIATWLVLVAMAILASRMIRQKWQRRLSPQAIASAIERAFPELDNHLINYLQFSKARDGDAFKKAYVGKGVTQFGRLDLAKMKNQKRHRNYFMALGGALAIFIAPALFGGKTWLTAVSRIANPFSEVAPVTLTHILEVTPGTTTVLKGDPLVIRCKIQGKRGHPVRIDVDPSDDDKTVYKLGQVDGGETQEFAHRIAKVHTALKYRVRAGDAPPSPWYEISARLPLAFTDISMTVSPPDYTGLQARDFDALVDSIEIFQGSRVQVDLTVNQEIAWARLTTGAGDPLEFNAIDDARRKWRAEFPYADGRSLKCEALNTFDEIAQSLIAVNLIADRPPAIRVTQPQGRIMLKTGITPNITFSVNDDFGLSSVRLERVEVGADRNKDGIALTQWEGKGSRLMDRDWTGLHEPVRDSITLAYRIVATDASPLGARVTRSPIIVFDTTRPESQKKASADQDENARTLQQLVDLQEANLSRTRTLSRSLTTTHSGQWTDTATRQRDIRTLAGQLLDSPIKPLGALKPTVRKLYFEEMQEVVVELRRIPAISDVEQLRVADHCIAMEESILRKLRVADRAAAKTVERRKVSDLTALLEALIKGEKYIISATENYARQEAKVGETLVDRQDDLALDVTGFVKRCRDEAPSMEKNNPEYAKVVRSVATKCEASAIKTDMLKAAEQLETNVPELALPLERLALAKLMTLQEMLNAWQVAEARQDLGEMVSALETARKKLAKIRELQEKVLKTMEQVRPTLDKSGDEAEAFEEEVAEIEKKIRDSLLQVANDLHIFPELSVANELVEDVVTVFQAVEQAEGSENMGAEDAEEIGYLKPEDFIEIMKKAEGRMEDTEMWLKDTPDNKQFTAEAFDKEELPEMALGALPEAFEDIIGELLEETEELDEKTDDSATNQGVPDLEAGGPIEEGPQESFGAKGKSGNQKPDHNEQSGRSLVGRQGQSNGETAAGEGKINKGDENIEERMTDDPHQEGKVDAEGEADTKATGGGKQGSGSADAMGIATKDGIRRDSDSQGNLAALEALLAKTEAVHIKASLMNLRTESVGEAAHHMKQAADTIARGLPIDAVREHHRRAVTALKRAQTELNRGVSVGISEAPGDQVVDDAIAGAPDEAPPAYRDLVAEYFRSLSDSL
jgi:hypothetical protein